MVVAKSRLHQLRPRPGSEGLGSRLDPDRVSRHGRFVQICEAAPHDYWAMKQASHRDSVPLRIGYVVENNPRQLCRAYQGEGESFSAIVIAGAVLETVQKETCRRGHGVSTARVHIPQDPPLAYPCPEKSDNDGKKYSNTIQNGIGRCGYIQEPVQNAEPPCRS